MEPLEPPAAHTLHLHLCRYNTILDLYFEIFLDEVSGLLKKGFIKTYKTSQANITALKGRLDFNRSVENILVHRERFYTHHQIYTYDHLINQILQQAMKILSKISTNPNIRDKLARLRLDLPEISDVCIQNHHFDLIPATRKTDPYHEALKIAQMIILDYSPDIKNGRENMLALLFDMNKLWEEYIYRKMLKSKPDNCQVNFQNSMVFWESASSVKTIRPDIVVTYNNKGQKENFVIDTKWKIVDFQQPDDDDLKQMYAYNMYWDAGKCMLLYPKLCENNESWGDFRKGRDYENRCKMAFVDVINPDSNGLNLKIGEEIFLKLFDNQ